MSGGPASSAHGSPRRADTAGAILWNAAGAFGGRAIQFAATVVLARLLSPAEFGMVAVLAIFTYVATALIESGFGSALIQMQAVTREDESAVFHFNLAMAVLLYAALWFLAEPIARFYGQPELVPLARVLALVFFCNAFGLVQSTLLTKQLDFRRLTLAQLGATLASGSLGIFLALRGWGVWSLAAQTLSAAAVRSGLLWFLSPWRPLRRFHLASLRAMFPYGSRLLASGLLGSVLENVYAMVIGRFFTQADVGFYSRAQLAQRQAADSFTGVIVTVSFPAYAAVQHDPERLREGYRRSIVYASAALFPLMLGLAALARPLFLLVFTAKWAASIPYFQILCLSGLLYHLHALNLNVLKAVGRSDLYLRLAVLKVGLVLAGLLVSVRFGMWGIVWGQVLVSWLGLGLNAFYAGRIIHYPLHGQIRDVQPYFWLSAGLAGLVFAASRVLQDLPLAVQTAVLALGYAGGYLGLAWLFRLDAPAALFRQFQLQIRRRFT